MNNIGELDWGACSYCKHYYEYPPTEGKPIGENGCRAVVGDEWPDIDDMEISMNSILCTLFVKGTPERDAPKESKSEHSLEGEVGESER